MGEHLELYVCHSLFFLVLPCILSLGSSGNIRSLEQPPSLQGGSAHVSLVTMTDIRLESFTPSSTYGSNSRKAILAFLWSLNVDYLLKLGP